jgi:hypothetical protein
MQAYKIKLEALLLDFLFLNVFKNKKQDPKGVQILIYPKTSNKKIY